MNWELKNIEKLTDDKWVNLYRAEYLKNDKKISWAFCSRCDIDNLKCKVGHNVCDTIMIVPKYMIDGEEYLILIKEFRCPINDYIYAFPAGLVEDKEDIVSAVRRELKEEIGATAGYIKQLTNCSYNSEGLTDENVIIFEANVESISKQELEDNEDITVEMVAVKDLDAFLKDKLVSAKAALYCTMYKEMYDIKNSKNIQYKFIKDIVSYVEVGQKTGALDDFWIKKIGSVYARPGVLGENIVTYITDGVIETTNVVGVDHDTGKTDMVVTSSFGDTYVVDYKTFNLKYEPTNEKNIYNPISNPIRAVRINENIEFVSHTGRLFRVKKDDYLIIPSNRYIYGITKESLYENYEFIKN